MPLNIEQSFNQAHPYSARLTGEQFLFYEMRTTAKLRMKGLPDAEIIDRIVSENLYQYPTERSLRKIARGCLHRLDAMENDTLISAIVELPSSSAKQICLYAMMRQYRLVWDFMISVIGEKFLRLDTTFRRADVRNFLAQLQEQDDVVAAWHESTIAKIDQVLVRILIETEYLDHFKADSINPVLIHPILEEAIRTAGLTVALSAFHCIA